MACAPNIRTADGRSITPPRIQIPACPALVRQLAKQLADSWNTGGDFNTLAATLLAGVCHHIRTTAYEQLDPTIADAIEDHMNTELPEGDADAAAEVAPHEVPGRVDFDCTPISGNRVLAVRL